MNNLTAKRRFCYSGFVTDFVTVILSQSEGLGKMALGIVKIYLGSPFSANRHCPRSVCSWSVGSRSVCRGQLSWTHFTIQIILQKLFPDKSTRFFGMNKRQFRKLFNWTCKTTALQFDGKFYHQIDGMAMGSLLAPTMADIFMNWLVETASTKSNHQFTVHRYVNDLFLTFDDPNHIDHVFSTFNSIH